jgi:glutamate synthase domain-containing protein 2
MAEWGVPSLYLHTAAYKFARHLEGRGLRVPDMAFAGAFSSEDGIFKALALGAPYTKAVCMGRALMIPGMVGKNIAKWMAEKDLPKTVSAFGTTPEEIFTDYSKVKDLVGADEMPNIPLGAVGIYSYCDRIRVGLQQLMAGARCFNLPSITRNELMSLTEECAKLTGIPYVMDAYLDEAMEILNS